MAAHDVASILVVDDQPETLILLTRILQERGYLIQEARDATEAQKFTEQFSPDLILLDVLLPGVDGFEICRQLKQNPTTSQIPVLFMSALDEEQHKLRGFEVGGVDYLTKPLRENEVLARVETHLTVSRQQRKLKQKNEELRTLHRAIEQVPASVIITNPDGRIEFVNPAFSATSGYGSEEAIGNNPRILKSGKHPAEFYRDMWATLVGGEVWRGEMINKRKNGDFYWEFVTIAPVKSATGVTTHYVAIKQDISERKRVEEKIAYLASHDSLTGLTNRQAFARLFKRNLEAAADNGGLAAVLFLDLDDFKAVNDRFGHDIGDLLLAEVAKRMQQEIRKSDVAGRMGGDEFLVQLVGISSDAVACEIGRKILNAISQTFVLDGQRLNVGCSIGVALYPRDGLTAEALTRKADMAMYEAKKRGKNQLVLA